MLRSRRDAPRGWGRGLCLVLLAFQSEKLFLFHRLFYPAQQLIPKPLALHHASFRSRCRDKLEVMEVDDESKLLIYNDIGRLVWTGCDGSMIVREQSPVRGDA